VYEMPGRFQEWLPVVLNLLIGLGWTWKAIEGIVTEKRVTGRVLMLLSAGVSVIAVGWLHVIGIVDERWLMVSLLMAIGLLCLGAIASDEAAGGPKGLVLTLGVVAILGAFFMGLGKLLSSLLH
jgi:hypothetical protein